MKLNNTSILLVVMLALVSGITGCDSNEEATVENPSEPTSTPTEPADPKTRALAAKAALFERLSGRLVQAMSNGGPAAAIEVCSKEAASIASEVGAEQGVRIGRTSFKLRNTSNRPPEWAESLVESRTEEAQFLDLPDGHFGAFLPIRIMPQCLNCHGPVDQIDAEVLARLESLYPDDQATGFAIDDLRGWFWIEVPPAESDGA